MENKKITAYVAGCSGGHITPVITLARQQHVTSPLFFTRNNPLDKAMFPREYQNNILFLPINVAPRKNIFGILRFSQQFVRSLFISIHMLRKNRVESIVTTGSYVALPVCIAAWMLRIPITLYELNIEPGLAIKFLAPLATTIRICFAQTKNHLSPKKCVLTDYPIRMTDEDKQHDVTTVLQSLGFDSTRKTLFVLGGSQGSGFLNEKTIEALASNSQLAQHWQVIHQSGFGCEDIQKRYDALKIPAHVFSYEPHLAHYFCAADCIISRAGAGCLAEIIFFNKRAIIIPHKNTTTDHQEKNARALEALHPELLTIIDQNDDAAQHIVKVLANIIQKS